MFISIKTPSTQTVSRGQFQCPRCGVMGGYTHCRRVIKRYQVIVFFPVGGVSEVLDEFVQCDSCNSQLELSVLLDAGVDPEALGVTSTLKNVVTFSDAAADEIVRRMAAGGFEVGTYVRLVPDQVGRECQVTFDVPYADDGEWLGRDHGLSIVIDRDLAEAVMGMEIHFDRDLFYTRTKPRER